MCLAVAVSDSGGKLYLLIIGDIGLETDNECSVGGSLCLT